jgi:PhoH-like ATPase
MPKAFVLDTNVLLHNADALFSFADNEVVIPIDVLEELDQFKAENTDLGRNARMVARNIDRLRAVGSLSAGVRIKETGGVVRIELKSERIEATGLREDSADNRIISVAFRLMKEGRTVIFVSKDVNARIKADALGIKAMDYEKQKVNFDEFYTGWRKLTVPGRDVDRFYKEKKLPFQPDGFYPNEFLLLADEADEKHTALARVDLKTSCAVPLKFPGATPWGVSARNLEQQMVIELLMDDRVQLVTLVGRAGTGKTLLALAAALTKVLEEHAYEKLLVSRPIMPLGRDIGFLPGTKNEKLEQWMHPIFDNLKYLMNLRRLEKGVTVDRQIDKLVDGRIIELEALTYIRGRSIPRQFLIVDEAQNLTPHEVKTVISRVGEGSKMVMTGDPYQIDNPYLDSSSNGLTYTAERMKEQHLFGHVMLTRNERSELASLAAELL